MTPTQKYLKSLNACNAARTWVGERSLADAWVTCDQLYWMWWLIKTVTRAEYRRTTAPAWAEYSRTTAPAYAKYSRTTSPARAEYDSTVVSAWNEYDRATSPARAEYARITALIKVSTTCAKTRQNFQCPQIEETC